MELKKVDVKEFQKNLYKEYKKIFPSDERKSYVILDYFAIFPENQSKGYMHYDKIK